jgi:3',5'-cyclic AMP phosphodiesterase CpdA
MKTIMHISDLHFGKVDPIIRDALAREIRAEPPHVIAVSGDLTQRARVSQFQEFCAFAGEFSVPKVVVPGNHDIPLFDVVRRFFSPLARFRRIVESDLSPVYEDDEVFVLGANTAHSWTVAGGRFSEETISAIRTRFRGVNPKKLRVLVCHHPLHSSPDGREGWVGGLDKIGERIDLVLTGHLHQSENEVLSLREENGENQEPSSVVLVRAGTAISDRHRGETNSYNLIRVYPQFVEIELRAWSPAEGVFQAKGTRQFPRERGADHESQLLENSK